MDRTGRSIRLAYWILLVTMTIQGLTPDQGSLTSSWLFRLLATGPFGTPSPDPIPTRRDSPLPLDHEDRTPGEVCAPSASAAAPRAREAAPGLPTVFLDPTGLFEPPPRSTHRTTVSRSSETRSPADAITSLCRLVC